jgi:hypothetical protein
MLTPEERQRIEEEERKRIAEEQYRAEVRAKLQRDAPVSNTVVAEPVRIPPSTTRVLTPQAPQEKILMDEQKVKVTSARFLVKDQTYAMSGITSVRTHVDRPSKLGPIVTIVLGALVLTNGPTTAWISLVVVVVGVFWYRSIRPRYEVVLTTAAGEQRPVKSSDGVFVEKMVKAINDAIVHRG